MVEKLTKTQAIVLEVVLILIILATVAFLIGFLFKRPPPPEIEIKPSVKETLTERQLKELDELRKEAKPLTKEQLQAQMEELEKLRKEAPPLTQKDLQKQLEELEELRSK